MSFGGQNASQMPLKKFVTEDEVEENKRKRQEQWDKVRRPDQPLECPEEETRSLFEQLEDQREKKSQEYEDEQRLRNSVKGLEDDEVHFLDFVSKRQMQIEKERRNEEASLFKEMRDAAVTRVAEKSLKDGEKQISRAVSSGASTSNRKSQQSLLCGAVKRKSADTQEDAKKQKVTDIEDENIGSSSSSHSKEETETSSETGSVPQRGGVARVIGILPGIGAYSDEDTESNSSTSDSDLDDLMQQQKIVKRIHIQAAHH